MSIVSKKLQSPSITGGTDPNFNQVALLLHGDGTNGAQNNTFVDSSSNNFSITRTGNVAQGTFSPFSLPDGQWSNYFDGSGDYLTAPNNAAFAYGTGDFTIEFWLYANNVSGTITLFDQRTSGNNSIAPLIYTLSGVVYYHVNGSNVITGSALSTSTWYHIAVSKSGSSTKLFINGTQSGSTYTDNNNYISNPLYIGDNSGSIKYPLNGYISNLRVVKGTAVYTSNFTPPTAPLTAITNTQLLTCQSNRFIDNSSNNFTITSNGDTRVTAFSPFAPSAAYSASTNGGSGYFDGSGDYLSSPNNTAIHVLGSDFCLEGWFYLTAVQADRGLYSTYAYSGGTDLGYFVRLDTTFIRFYYGDGSGAGIAVDRSYTFTQGQWYHFAVTNSGGTGRLFINGQLQGTTFSFTNPTNSTQTLQIARTHTATNDFPGYLSDFRIVKGTAVYTSNFTPPTSPLTAISGTSLLCNFTNAGIIDNAGKNDIETVGNAQVSTSVKKYGTGSMAFDGTGDYLSIPNSSNLQLGSGNFTIEFWLYPTSVTSVRQIINTQTGSTAVNYSYAIITNGTSCVYYLSSTGTTWDIANGVSIGTVALNTWYHVALVRNGSTITPYLNGVAGTTATVGTTSLYNMLGPVQIGRGGTVTGNDFTGNLDDFRITKGLARYTSNFTPSTQAFPDQ